jgi:hypothetical protein
MPDLPPLLRRLAELEASRKRGGTAIGVGACIIGLAIIFGELRPAPGVAPWQIQLLGGFIFTFGLFWVFHSLRMPRASTAAFSIAGLLMLAITHWAAFGPGQRICTSGRLRIPTSEADCRFWFGVISLVMDAVVVLAMAAFVARRK